MFVISPGKAMIAWQQPDIRSSDGTNAWEDLGRELTAEKKNLNNFQGLTNHLVLDFNLDYGQGASIQLRHLVQLKEAARWLASSALYNLHQRNTEGACANVHTMLAIISGQAEERLELSQLVRMAIANMALGTTWEILQDPEVSEDDLTSLQEDWQKLEFIKPAEETYLMERFIDMRSMEQWRRHPDDLWRGITSYGGITEVWCKKQWQLFWSYTDEKRALQTREILIKATQMAETNKSFQQAQLFVQTNFIQLGFKAPQLRDEGSFRIDIDEFAVRWLLSENAYDSFALLRRAMTMETTRNLLVTSIALKRYELQRHQFPSTLDELISGSLRSVPIDFMDGKPLQYRRNADGTFLSYSVGENGKDDGGNPSLEKNEFGEDDFWPDSRALDWVWPQPANAMEIEKYYDQEDKSERSRLELEKYYKGQHK